MVPHPGEFGYDTWPPDAWKTVGGVHNWNEMTVDEKRGIAYIPLGTARYDFYGANRKGDNLFGNSLLALDARTGKRLWHFQMVHHDLWDYDLPVAPKLLTVKHNGKNVDAGGAGHQVRIPVRLQSASQASHCGRSKSVRFRRSDVPGEWSFAHAAVPRPSRPPFARQSFTEKDINPFVAEADQAQDSRSCSRTRATRGCSRRRACAARFQRRVTTASANWGMVAVNPTKGFLYVITKEHPTLDKFELRQGTGPGAGGRGVNGATAAAPVLARCTRRGATAPSVHYISRRSTSLPRAADFPRWARRGPTLTAYDLNSGTIRWQVPNGGVLALEKEGHNGTGARAPRGGPVVTAGGLIFAATASDHKVRAYDEDTGKVLWEYELPTGSDGVPAVYEVGGREYIAFCVAAGNGLNLGGRREAPSAPPPNAYVVFSLPKK